MLQCHVLYTPLQWFSRPYVVSHSTIVIIVLRFVKYSYKCNSQDVRYLFFISATNFLFLRYQVVIKFRRQANQLYDSGIFTAVKFLIFVLFMTVLQSGRLAYRARVVRIATRRRVGRLTNHGSVPAVTVQGGTRALFQRAKRPECETEHSPPSNSKVPLWRAALFLSVIWHACTNFSPQSPGQPRLVAWYHSPSDHNAIDLGAQN